MTDALTVGSLFAGIGGFDLGFERAGMRSVWQSEIDPYAQRVLARHWPDVLRVPDVRDVGADTVPWVDVICGGFPCQDLSYAGAGAGIDGARSGLWAEYARVVGELRPRYVVVENVAALLARGLERVLGDLAALGYDAEWDCIPASAVGAPHQRDRVWLVAYPASSGEQGEQGRDHDGGALVGAEPRAGGRGEPRGLAAGGVIAGRDPQPVGPSTLPDTDGGRLEVRGERDGWQEGLELAAPQRRDADRLRAHVADTDGERGHGARLPGRHEPSHGYSGGDAWAVEPDVGRVAHGVPARVDRLRALGNALVPQIAEWIGRRIVAHEQGVTA